MISYLWGLRLRAFRDNIECSSTMVEFGIQSTIRNIIESNTFDGYLITSCWVGIRPSHLRIVGNVKQEGIYRVTSRSFILVCKWQIDKERSGDEDLCKYRTIILCCCLWMSWSNDHVMLVLCITYQEHTHDRYQPFKLKIAKSQNFQITFLLLVGCSFCQKWEGPESQQLTIQVPTRSGAQQMRPLWSASSSSVYQNLWSNTYRNGQDHSNDLERQLSLTGPMVFPHGHEGMFYIPPAPHHLPRPVHGLHRNVQRVPAHSPQVGKNNASNSLISYVKAT